MAGVTDRLILEAEYADSKVGGAMVRAQSVNDNDVGGCEAEIEDEHIQLIEHAVMRGWSERQAAMALLNRATAHIQLLDGMLDDDLTSTTKVATA